MKLFSTPWDLLSIFIILFFGWTVIAKIAGNLKIPPKRAIALYAWHTFFCVVYATYSLYNIADSTVYYQQAINGDVSFSFGAAAVSFISIFFAKILGLSYLGTFLIYNIFGCIGLINFDASLQTVSANKSRKVRYLATLIVFLPSASFWSSALGKDSIAFMGTGLALWAALNLKRRAWLMGIAIIVMLLVRPHIAGMLVIALAGSQLTQRGVPLIQRILIGGIAIIAAFALIPFALHYAGVSNDASTQELVSYIQQRQQANLGGGSSIDIASMPLPLQLFTYIFRPLPFDVSGISTLIEAIENIILLSLFMIGGWHMLIRRYKFSTMNRAFMWQYALLSWLILALTTANLGIAVRQKWMFLPMLIFLVISRIGKPRNTMDSARLASRHYATIKSI